MQVGALDSGSPIRSRTSFTGMRIGGEWHPAFLFDPFRVVRTLLSWLPRVSPGAIHIGPLRGPRSRWVENPPYIANLFVRIIQILRCAQDDIGGHGPPYVFMSIVSLVYVNRISGFGLPDQVEDKLARE